MAAAAFYGEIGDKHEGSGALLESRVSTGSRTRPPRHRDLHEAGGAAAPEDTRPTRYCSPPLASTPPSTPRWHTARRKQQPTNLQPRHTRAHTITVRCIRALSVRASPRSLTQLSDRQTTDRHTARLRPWLVPLLSSRSRNRSRVPPETVQARDAPRDDRITPVACARGRSHQAYDRPNLFEAAQSLRRAFQKRAPSGDRGMRKASASRASSYMLRLCRGVVNRVPWLTDRSGVVGAGSRMSGRGVAGYPMG